MAKGNAPNPMHGKIVSERGCVLRMAKEIATIQPEYQNVSERGCVLRMAKVHSLQVLVNT
jgi:hypothetical protein